MQSTQPGGSLGEAEGAQSTVTGQNLASISTQLVQLHSRYYGKGPTKAKTFLVDDTVVSLLRGGFTRVEKTLMAMGEADAVENVRRSFQRAMEGQFREVVEKATGRHVIAYMSQIHQDPDIAAELFVLEPTGESVVAQHEQDVEPGSELD